MRKVVSTLAATIAVVAALLALVPSSADAPHRASAAPGAVFDRAAPAAATAGAHTVTFVNSTGKKIWVGSAVNADGSRNFGSLPVLAPGQSATVTVPEDADPGHWRGKFFARMGCSGESGSSFHCELGDCGVFADHCAPDTGEQPVSLAEFNFDRADGMAPWYNVSYVNAFSVPITITPTEVSGSGAGCGEVGCAEDLLPKCPAGNLTRWDDGTPKLCTSPNRDAKTPYSDMIATNCPKAYGWSGQDQEPGNQVVQQCSRCSGFTVEFHRGA
ncbi:thaumatin family protein [Streptomyces ramulosus]